MKSLVRTRPFNRDLARLPRDARADIVADLQAYAAGETGYDVKRLRGVDEYRMKLPSYRVRFLEGPDRITLMSVGRRAGFYDDVRD